MAAAGPLLQIFLPIVIPMLLSLLKKIWPDMPPVLLPALAPAIGAVGNLAIAGTGNPVPTVLLGSALGSAGVGVRELYDQVKKAPQKAK